MFQDQVLVIWQPDLSSIPSEWRSQLSVPTMVNDQGRGVYSAQKIIISTTCSSSEKMRTMTVDMTLI